MDLNKEECEKALYQLRLLTANEDEKSDENHYLWYFQQLIKVHFDSDKNKLLKTIKEVERVCKNYDNENAESMIDEIERLCMNAYTGTYPVADAIDEVANSLVKILKDNSQNLPRMEMLLSNEEMKLQQIAENLGKFYID